MNLSLNLIQRPSTIGILGALVLLPLWLSLATPSGARTGSQTVNEAKPLAADGRVSVECLAGSVTIVGADKNEVSVEGSIPDYCTLEITGSQERLRVEVKWPERNHWRHRDNEEQAVITVRVPREAESSANTVSADIEASGLAGELTLESVSGDVTASDAPKSIEAKSVSGTIKITAQSKRVVAESVSGDVDLDGPSGEVELSTVSGSVEVRGGGFEKARATAVSGDIRFDAGIVAEGHLTLSSHSGRVEVTLPSDISADFQVETFSGSIDSDFGGRSHRTSRHAPGRTLEFTAGTGSAQIDLSSFSGDVIIRKK
jgi:hypothetical protein